MANNILAITTCRVSTPEQLESNSLNRQGVAVIKAAQELEAKIPDDGQWSGSVSSKAGTNTKRKDLKQMLDYCKRHPRVKYLIVHEVDRFMRSIKELFYFEVEFEKVGVKVWYASQPELNTDDPHSKLLKALEAFKSEGSNLERQKKSIDGQTAAIREGRYPSGPKPGYMKGKMPAIQELHPVRGPALRRVLKRIAAGLISPTDGLIELNNSEFTSDHGPYKMDKFPRIATDPFNAGILTVNKQVKVDKAFGLHEPLITIQEHERLLEIFSKKPKYQTGPNPKGNPKFPLSNMVSDDACTNVKDSGRIVGFEHSNGKNKALIYEKYRCRSCKRYWHKEHIHNEIECLFNSYELTSEGRHEILDALDVVWKQNEQQIHQEIIRLKQSIHHLESDIEAKVEAATDPANAAIKQDILVIIDKKKAELKSLQDNLEEQTAQQESDKREFMDFALRFVSDMSKCFLDGTISRENRTKCKQLMFPAGILINQKNKVYTPEVSAFYRAAPKKKSAEALDNSHLVRVKRL